MKDLSGPLLSPALVFSFGQAGNIFQFWDRLIMFPNPIGRKRFLPHFFPLLFPLTGGDGSRLHIPIDVPRRSPF